MQDLTLVVMAAGMGSRFGGLKQLQAVDDDGNFLLDYSIYDAIKAGFTKVVLVIKEELLSDFKNTVGKRLDNKIKVEYAFQRLKDIPLKDESILKMREKPWGTSQAIYCSHKYVNGSFAVINADDFYGFKAFKEVADFLKNDKQDYNYVAIPYEYSKTASECGSVKRGVCKIIDGKLKKIIECSIKKDDDKIIATPLDGRESFEIKENTLVSMNMFGFKNDFYELLEKQIEEYFKQDKETILNNEILLPLCLEKNLDNNKIIINCKPVNSEWIGMTYKEDLLLVNKKIANLKEEGSYPKHLWE